MIRSTRSESPKTPANAGVFCWGHVSVMQGLTSLFLFSNAPRGPLDQFVLYPSPLASNPQKFGSFTPR